MGQKDFLLDTRYEDLVTDRDKEKDRQVDRISDRKTQSDKKREESVLYFSYSYYTVIANTGKKIKDRLTDIQAEGLGGYDTIKTIQQGLR